MTINRERKEVFMEELYAELLLWYIGFHSSDAYNALLDFKFLKNTGNDIYLELESCSSDLLDSMGRFSKYWEYECIDFNPGLFGKRLFSGLKTAYNTNTVEISDFGDRCFKLWRMLLDCISKIEPFQILSYADEPLSWGDEAQTRQLYENAFTFYDTGRDIKNLTATNPLTDSKSISFRQADWKNSKISLIAKSIWTGLWKR